MDNLEETGNLVKISLPRLNQEGIEIISNPITNTKIESDLKSPPKQKPSARWLHRGILSNI